MISKVDSRELEQIATRGPMILSMNHINFLEVPLIQAWLMPRKMRGFVKRETWNNRFMSFLFNTYRAIPVDRGGSNMQAFREVKSSLEEEYFICIAPEGTRSGNGVLQEGKPGITMMALMTGAPIMPVIHYGGQDIWKNLKRLKRTPVHWKTGRPFRIKTENKPDSSVRDEITKEIMYQMAILLPEELRGQYSDLSSMTSRHLEFLPGEET